MKNPIIYFVFLFLAACSAQKSSVDPQNEIGSYKIDKDNVSIITPYIELKLKSNQLYIEQEDKRESLINFIIDFLKSQYPNADYVEIPLMFQDYRSVSSEMDRKMSYLEEDMPTELITDKNKNSIFISMNSYYGDLERVVMILHVIDNESKKWKTIERYIHDFSPLDKKKMEKSIVKILEHIEHL